MPRYDLNGNPLPDDTAAPAPPPAAAPVGASYPTGNQPPSHAGGQQYPPPSTPAPYSGGQYAPRQTTPPGPGSTGPILPPAARTSTINPGLIVGGVIALTIIVVCAVFVIGMLFPAPVPAPSGYEPYALDGGMTIDKPAGWTVSPIDKTQGSDAVKISGGVEFTRGTARIEIADGTPMDPTSTGVERIAEISNAMSTTPADMAARRYRRLAKNHLWGYQTDHTDYDIPSSPTRKRKRSQPITSPGASRGRRKAILRRRPATTNPSRSCANAARRIGASCNRFSITSLILSTIPRSVRPRKSSKTCFRTHPAG